VTPYADRPTTGGEEYEQVSNDLPTPANAPEVVRLAPGAGFRRLGLGDLWRDRELLWFLTERDLKIRYKQTVFGAAWAIGQPLVMMVVFTLVFDRIANVRSEGLPYEVFVLGGLVPWGLVATGVPTASTSLLSNVSLITKVRIANIVVPAAAVCATLVDLAISVVLLVVIAAAYGIYPGPEILLLPFFVSLGVAIVFGIGLLLAAINVLFRDIRYVVPFAVQAWLFLTPVVYPTREISGSVRWIYALNPMVGVVEGVRWSALGTGSELGTVVPVSVVAACVLVGLGTYIFRRIEPRFADVV
jgi:lipopolysaccharide transport system permease protein